MNSRIINLYNYMQHMAAISKNVSNGSIKLSTMILDDAMIERLITRFARNVLVLKVDKMLFAISHESTLEILRVKSEMMVGALKYNKAFNYEDYQYTMKELNLQEGINIAMNEEGFNYIINLYKTTSNPALVIDLMISFDNDVFLMCNNISKIANNPTAFQDTLAVSLIYQNIGCKFNNDNYQTFLAQILLPMILENKLSNITIDEQAIEIMAEVFPIEYMEGHLCINNFNSSKAISDYILSIYQACYTFKNMVILDKEMENIKTFIENLYSIPKIVDLSKNLTLFSDFRTQLTYGYYELPILQKITDSQIAYDCIQFHKFKLDDDLAKFYTNYNAIRNIANRVNDNLGIQDKRNYIINFINSYSFIFHRSYACTKVPEYILDEILVLCYFADMARLANPVANVDLTEFKTDKLFNLLVTRYLINSVDHSAMVPDIVGSTNDIPYILKEPFMDFTPLRTNMDCFKFLKENFSKTFMHNMMSYTDLITVFPYVTYDKVLEAKTMIIYNTLGILKREDNKSEAIKMILGIYLMRHVAGKNEEYYYGNCDELKWYFRIFDHLYKIDILDENFKVLPDKKYNLDSLYDALKLLTNDIKDLSDINSIKRAYYKIIKPSLNNIQLWLLMR